MNRLQTGLFALTTLGFLGGAMAANEVTKLTPEQAQAYEVQAQQTDSALGESEPIIQGDISAEARRISCYARDALRTTYRVTAYNYPAPWVQREAVRYCQRMSRIPFTCRAIGCN